MDTTPLIQMAQQTLFLSALVAAPLVLCAAVVGVIMGLFQSIFSVQDASLAHAFRAGSVFALMIVISGWAGSQVFEFAVRVFQMIG
jgi:flagellar biosynthesis protein FliQ